jgi:hypothetical protein
MTLTIENDATLVAACPLCRRAEVTISDRRSGGEIRYTRFGRLSR